MKSFESWKEAYDYQVTSRKCSDDPLFMSDFDINSGVEAIDELIATTGLDIVWLVSKELEKEHYIQFGVSVNERWYSIEFDGNNIELEVVKDSLKQFYQLPSLIESDKNALLILEHIEAIFDVYKFLTTGKIYPSDTVKDVYLQNANKVKEYAINELEKYKSKSLDAYSDGVCYEETYSNDDDDGEYKDDDDEFEEYDDEVDNELEPDNVFISSSDNYNKEDSCQDCQECECNKAKLESMVDENKVEKVEELPIKEERHMYTITYGKINDNHNDEIYCDEMTFLEADKVFNEIVEMGYEYVQLSQVKRIHLRFE